MIPWQTCFLADRSIFLGLYILDEEEDMVEEHCDAGCDT